MTRFAYLVGLITGITATTTTFAHILKRLLGDT